MNFQKFSTLIRVKKKENHNIPGVFTVVARKLGYAINAPCMIVTHWEELYSTSIQHKSLLNKSNKLVMYSSESVTSMIQSVTKYQISQFHKVLDQLQNGGTNSVQKGYRNANIQNDVNCKKYKIQVQCFYTGVFDL